MEELQSAVNAHFDQMADLVKKLSAEFRSGLKPAYENFMGFFHAIDWKVLSWVLRFYVLIKCFYFLGFRIALP
ncbi:hypothetical protein SASPL_133643 [Salvia splendens]|uniref:Uncharacterized protein n=1 Tax=Salvia splendens TaxID=180675 RepID=A0A8X8ZIA9_SALSN|nr:hypothetical protein SASPL_133643 [Salvia splendens]